jgi:uncharacterized membrane protein
MAVLTTRRDTPLEQDHQDLSRLMALSDGLFAIVLTLLVLELKPDTAGGLTYEALVDLWPRLFAFFLTFLVGGSFWITHHADLADLVRYNQSLLWLNLMFLLSLSLLPFTTALIGGNITAVAWILYAVNVICLSLTQAAVWRYAIVAGLVERRREPKQEHFLTLRRLVTPLVFALTIPLAFVALNRAPFGALVAPLLYRAIDAAAGYRVRSNDRRADPRTVWKTIGCIPVLLFAAWSIWLLLTGEALSLPFASSHAGRISVPSRTQPAASTGISGAVPSAPPT